MEDLVEEPISVPKTMVSFILGNDKEIITIMILLLLLVFFIPSMFFNSIIIHQQITCNSIY